MNAFSFGSYYPGESPLHRLDPRTGLPSSPAPRLIWAW